MVNVKMKCFKELKAYKEFGVVMIEVGVIIEIEGIECESDRSDGTFNDCMVLIKDWGIRGQPGRMNIKCLLEHFGIVDCVDYGLLCLLHDRVEKETIK